MLLVPTESKNLMYLCLSKASHIKVLQSADTAQGTKLTITALWSSWRLEKEQPFLTLSSKTGSWQVAW